MDQQLSKMLEDISFGLLLTFRQWKRMLIPLASLATYILPPGCD